MHFIKYYDEQCTYIENRYLWKVLKCLPFSSEVLHGANYDDMFELVVVEVGCPEGHHQVPQANQGAVVVCEEADYHMSVQDSHGCLVPVLRWRVWTKHPSVTFLIRFSLMSEPSWIGKCRPKNVDLMWKPHQYEIFKFSHQYAILYAARRGPVEHASAVVLHLSLLKVEVLRLVVGDPDLKLPVLLLVRGLVRRPAIGLTWVNAGLTYILYVHWPISREAINL